MRTGTCFFISVHCVIMVVVLPCVSSYSFEHSLSLHVCAVACDRVAVVCSTADMGRLDEQEFRFQKTLFMHHAKHRSQLFRNCDRLEWPAFAFATFRVVCLCRLRCWIGKSHFVFFQKRALNTHSYWNCWAALICQYHAFATLHYSIRTLGCYICMSQIRIRFGVKWKTIFAHGQISNRPKIFGERLTPRPITKPAAKARIVNFCSLRETSRLRGTGVFALTFRGSIVLMCCGQKSCIVAFLLVLSYVMSLLRSEALYCLRTLLLIEQFCLPNPADDSSYHADSFSFLLYAGHVEKRCIFITCWRFHTKSDARHVDVTLPIYFRRIWFDWRYGPCSMPRALSDVPKV